MVEWMFLLLLIDLYNKLIAFQIKFRYVQRIFDYFRIKIHLIIFAMQFMLDNFIKWKTKYLKIMLTKIFLLSRNGEWWSQFLSSFFMENKLYEPTNTYRYRKAAVVQFYFAKYFKFIKADVLVFSLSLNLNLNSPDEMYKIEFNDVRPNEVLVLKKAVSFD